LTDAHHDLPGHHLDALRKFLEVAVLLQPLVDFTHSLGLIVPQDDGEQEAALLLSRLRRHWLLVVIVPTPRGESANINPAARLAGQWAHRSCR
jgi:hypothetical protein